MSGDLSLQHPRLRPVEAFPAAAGRIGLRDPQGFSDKLLLLPPEAFFIVSLFDGRHSLLDIQTEYARRFGDLLFGDKLREIIATLDEALFLASERFTRARELAEREFAASPVRLAWHAGLSYEREPEALRAMLDGLLTGESASTAPDTSPAAGVGRLRALIAPHIDLQRGGACYAAAYRELRAPGAAGRTYVILGVSHVETRRRYTLTAKDFQTPLGSVAADREFVAALRARCRTDFCEDEFTHRSEHSVEFQALFLRHLLGEEARIVPVLCTALPQLTGSQPPETNTEAEEFIAALGAVLAERGEDAVLLAGADLSHVGRRFGQELTLEPELLQELERADLAMIEGILQGDAAGFFRGIQQEKDRRNVCGVPSIYTLLRLLPPGSRGHLLRYGQAPDASSNSVVTFMSAAFYG